MREILVTGIGALSAIGTSVAAHSEALRAERPAIGPQRYVRSLHSDIPVAEIPFSDAALAANLNIPPGSIVTRTSLIAIWAVKEALQGAGLLDPASRKGLRVGFISGNTVGGMEKSELYYMDFINPDTDAHTPYIDAHDCGSCSEKVADYFKGFHYVTSLCTACSSGANAIAMGARMLEANLLDAVIAGGTECISKFHLNGFNSLMILDKDACKPFDASRNGINLGEGAAYLVLEREADALHRRGSVPLARLSGFGNACDAFHQTATSDCGEGPYLAMKKALEDASVDPAAIGYVNAHGTGTGNNDLSELRAMERIFGSELPPFGSTKAFTGHTTSAAGALESVISIICLREGFLPANLNFREPMADCRHIPVLHTVPAPGLVHVLNNSFGFGGNSTSLIFTRMEKKEA